MPVDFDRSLWIEHYWLFHWLSEEALLPAHRVRRSDVDPSLWDLLDRETVDDTEYLALSPVLELMHQGFDLLPPTDLTPPPDSGRDPQSKLHINEDHMHHAPHGSRERLDRLAQLPWVTLVEPITYENTAVAGRVKTGGTATLDEIYVVHGDGEKGLKIRLRTTCRTNAERLWCLEQLKLEMTR